MQACRLLARSLSSQYQNRLGHTARLISTTNSLDMPLKEGDKLPSVDLFEGNPGKKVNTSELSKGKEHAPSFIKQADALKKKGVNSIVCVSVNDPFVMEAWGKSLGAGDKVRFLADTCAEFVKKADLSVDLSAVLGNVRSKRFAMVVEDGVVKGMKLEPDGTGLTCSKADDVLSFL